MSQPLQPDQDAHAQLAKCVRGLALPASVPPFRQLLGGGGAADSKS